MSQAPVSQPEKPATPPASPRGRLWANRLAVMAILGLVLGPVSFGFIPREIARWHAAAAQEADWSNDYPLAVEQLDKALAWDGNNVEWWLRRAQLHERYEKYDLALADCDIAVQVEPESLTAVLAHCQMALHAKHFDDAERDLKKAQELAGENSYLLDNEVAYLQAVANRDLDQSLTLVNHALSRHRDSGGDDSLLASLLQGDSFKHELREIAILDTRGYVFLQQGKAAEARTDLDQAVQRGKICLARQEAALRRNSTDPRQFERSLQEAKKTLAVMTYHRSLALEKLDLPIEAALDREEVRRLGFKPDDNLF